MGVGAVGNCTCRENDIPATELGAKQDALAALEECLAQHMLREVDAFCAEHTAKAHSQR